MTQSLDLFWSFRSPYSYLLVPRLLEFEQEYDVRVNVRPVYPLAVRSTDFFKHVDPLWWHYLGRDVPRVAEILGMPYSRPNPDPVVMNRETGEVARVQPYISRLTRLGVVATERGRGLRFIGEISAVIFGGTVDWHLGNHLRDATRRGGLELDELEQDVEAGAERIEKVIADNQVAQRASGHWGVPLMTFEGEPFFGQDRFDALKWRMTQKGLRRIA